MDRETALAARFGSGARKVQGYPLTVDATLRKITLPPGGWRLHGHGTQVYFATRWATNATGTLATGEAAPGAAIPAGTAGASAGFAWSDDGDVSDATPGASAVKGGGRLPTYDQDYVEFAVPQGQWLNVYLSAAAAAAPVLLGPYE